MDNTIDTLLKAWKNDKSRRDWLADYKSWDKMIIEGIDYYGLEFYECTLPDGRILIAMEHDTKSYSHLLHTTSYEGRRDVKYYVREGIDKHFVPDRLSSSYIANEVLKPFKVKLQGGNYDDFNQ